MRGTTYGPPEGTPEGGHLMGHVKVHLRGGGTPKTAQHLLIYQKSPFAAAADIYLVENRKERNFVKNVHLD